jgi:prevent-host-death family protein
VATAVNPRMVPTEPPLQGRRRASPRAYRVGIGSVEVLRGPPSYILEMNVATSQVEVGVRDLKNNLSRYLDRVRDGEDVIVTDRGKPVARLSAIDHSTDRLAELIAAGIVRPAKQSKRSRPARRITPKGSVSDLIAEQRR